MALEASILARYLGPAPADTRPVALSSRPGFWTRILNALIESRQQQAEREVRRMIELRGGKVTNDLDADIDRWLTRGGGL